MDMNIPGLDDGKVRSKYQEADVRNCSQVLSRDKPKFKNKKTFSVSTDTRLLNIQIQHPKISNSKLKFNAESVQTTVRIQ